MPVNLKSKNRPVKVPFSKSFSGHETFSLRYSWLKKAVDNLSADLEIFHSDDAVVRLGVGKNMVRSIRHWALATRVAVEKSGSNGKRVEPTTFGLKLFADNGWDPFLEDDATLWLLHWNLASSGTKAATWYWALNKFYEYAFSKTEMVDALSRFLSTLEWTDIADSTLSRDVTCFLNSYLSKPDKNVSVDEMIECPFTSLGLIVWEPSFDRMRFCVGPRLTLPIEVFAYALTEFWLAQHPDKRILDLREIVGLEGSPALIFKLDEDSVLSYLDQIKDVSSGSIVFEDTALVRRVVWEDKSSLDPIQLLANYYDNK